MSIKNIKLAPSILSADFSKLGEEVALATESGADMIHIDIMDGKFVPNITFGASMVSAIRRWTNLPLDIHMMVTEPEKQIPLFIDAGADIINVHIETCTHLHRIIQMIKSNNIRAGIALNPGTAITTLSEVIGELDQIVIMSVNPGFPGQNFIPKTLNKVSDLRNQINKDGLNTDIEIDGGINKSSIKAAVEAGANILVAGSAVYNSNASVSDCIHELKNSI
ncbi:MAG: ribulose-phosphate 3-epimerase [SAR202 cluster bacterium]|nr:ribulose-phosphate 3-epimerase [Chloroflexota bacterium]MQG84575.1 ribulose-phosphate 3-epimerase [SAR202 cluster bacterium]|tara:strand:- start:3213 stop:3878 length:666 start_codon:yes stop_codon:yes gene_type:complete